MQSFTTEKRSITTGYNAKKKNMIIYEACPKKGMEHKTDISEQGILGAVMVYGLFPLNQ